MTATNVDHVAVQRALDGDRTITLTDDDRHALIIAAYHRGMSDGATAAIVGSNQVRVRAIRDAAGLARRVNGAYKLDLGRVG